MFRWLVLCLVLCAGAFALVALATGAFNSQPGGPGEQAAAPPGPAVAGPELVQPPPNDGLGRGGAIVLTGAYLSVIEEEAVPSQRDGIILVIGTDEPADPENRGAVLAPIHVPFLVLEIDGKDATSPVDPKKLPPESEWLFLIPAAGSSFKEAAGPARLGKYWEDYKKSTAKVYHRWHEGDPLEPHKVEVAFEQKFFHKLSVGDWVNKDQLLALVDPTIQVNDVSSKMAKMEAAEADYTAAIQTKLEAVRRASQAEFLKTKGQGYISEDDYQAALLNRGRYIEEEKSKDAARKVAAQELSAALSILKLHEVRSSIAGVIKGIYKHPGESVRSLESAHDSGAPTEVMKIQNPARLRVEAQADQQDAQNLFPGMSVVVEPTRPVGPEAVLSGHHAEVTCVAVSRVGQNGKKLIVSGSEDNNARFWDWTAAQPLVGILDHHAGVLAVACTGPKAEANLALTGDRDGVGRLIDLDHLLPAPAPVAPTGDAAEPPVAPAPPIKLSERHKGPITCVAFSPDGNICATGGEDRAIRLWNAKDGKLLHTLYAAHKAAVTSLQFAKEEGEGKTLQLVSAGGDQTLVVWNLDKLATKAPTQTAIVRHRSGDVAQLGVSSDGRHMLFDYGPELRVLSLDSRESEGVIQSSAAGANFTTMALFSPDGAMVLTTTAANGRLQLWRTPGRSAADGQGRAAELRQLVSKYGVTCAAFDPDEKQPAFAVTGTRDSFVLVWPLPKEDEVLARPRETKLTLVDRALDAGARQMRVWAELDNPDWRKPTGLTPGGTATIVAPPRAATADGR